MHSSLCHLSSEDGGSFLRLSLHQLTLTTLNCAWTPCFHFQASYSGLAWRCSLLVCCWASSLTLRCYISIATLSPMVQQGFGRGRSSHLSMCCEPSCPGPLIPQWGEDKPSQGPLHNLGFFHAAPTPHSAPWSWGFYTRGSVLFSLCPGSTDSRCPYGAGEACPPCPFPRAPMFSVWSLMFL